MVVDSGTVMGKAGRGVSHGCEDDGWRGDSLSPAMFLTKICIVGSASTVEEARDDVEETEEMLLDRMVGGSVELCV